MTRCCDGADVPLNHNTTLYESEVDANVHAAPCRARNGL